MNSFSLTDLDRVDHRQPILIAGPTASGKSDLAMEIARRHGGLIVNADAIQVYSNWRVLSARPSAEDEAEIDHALYGHLARDAHYSVGHWLREVRPLILEAKRPIITGGTGLYFKALTQGLAELPPISESLRQEANDRVRKYGFQIFLDDLDAHTIQKLDVQNPMRVQRAWEVQQATGKSLLYWHSQTPTPDLKQIGHMVSRIREVVPNAKLVYNNSPSFNWTLNFRNQIYDEMTQEGNDMSCYDKNNLMDAKYDGSELCKRADEKIKFFQKEGSEKAGIFHHLITLPTYHTTSLHMNDLSESYFGDEGMLGYVKNVQRKEIRKGVECVKHQRMAGSDLGDDHKVFFAGEKALKAGGEKNTSSQFDTGLKETKTNNKNDLKKIRLDVI